MRSIALALSLVFASAGMAKAGTPFNWAGFYVGGFGGNASSTDATARDIGGVSGPANSTWGYSIGGSGIVGAQAGFNWQTRFFVYGIEGEVGYLRMSNQASEPTSPGGDVVSATTLGNVYGFIGGRVGAAFDRVLVYAKGGGAFFNVKSTVTDHCILAPCGGGTIDTSGSQLVSTWAVGGGVEFAITRHWTLKAEYLHIDLHSVSYDVTGRCGGACILGPVSFPHTLSGGIDTVKGGFNFKFN